MDQMWKMRERRFKNVSWVFACAARWMVMPQENYMKHILGRKLSSVLGILNLKCLFDIQVEKIVGRCREKQRDKYLHLSFYISIQSSMERLEVETEGIRVSIIQAIFKPLTIHPYLVQLSNSWSSFKTQFRHHLPRGFPRSPWVNPFLLLLGFLEWASIFPSNTVQ